MRTRSSHIDEFECTRGRLPHWEGPQETYFVTFCLRRPPAVDLTRPDVGRLVVDALRFLDGRRYDLYDYIVMPDHVHAILRPIAEDGRAERITRIARHLKHWLGVRINQILGRSGPVWQIETYDHALRGEKDYEEKASYIYTNAQVAGLVDDPLDWPWWGQGNGPR